MSKLPKFKYTIETNGTKTKFRVAVQILEEEEIRKFFFFKTTVNTYGEKTHLHWYYGDPSEIINHPMYILTDDPIMSCNLAIVNDFFSAQDLCRRHNQFYTENRWEEFHNV